MNPAKTISKSRYDYSMNQSLAKNLLQMALKSPDFFRMMYPVDKVSKSDSVLPDQ